MNEANRLSSFSQLKDRFSTIWKNSGDSIKFGTLVYALTRLWLTLVSVFIFFKIPILSPSVSGGSYTDVIPLLTGWRGALLGMWQRWDTIHYQSIAQWGYNKPYITAFFPGYPVLGHAVSRLLQISNLAGLLLVSNLFAWLSLILLHHIVKSLYDQHTANLALIFLVTFPSSFFLFAGYPQSMVLCCILFCYWEAKQGHWFWAALAALVAGLTHGTVVPLSLMLAWQGFQTLKSSRFSIRWAIALVPLMPVAGIGLFLSWRISQGYEQYASFMRQSWFRVYQASWNTLILGFKNLINFLDIVIFINCLICLLIIFAVVWSVKKLPGELKIYSISLAVFLFSTGTSFDPLHSINRYALVMFPTFIYLAVITAQNKKLRLALIEFNFIFYIYFCYLFFTWGWVG